MSKIKITNTNDIDLNSLTIYNLAGQQISAHNIDMTTKAIPINVSQGIYLLKFNTSSQPFTIILSLLAIGISMYMIIRDVINMQKQDEE